VGSGSVGSVMILAALGIVLLVVLFLWLVPKRQAARDGEKVHLENELRRTLVQAVGGVAVLLGALVTYRNFKETMSLTTRGQNNDRFTHAIDQLGKSKPEQLAIRLGGIYALEQLANDSEEYHSPVVEVLTAYVRENAPWPSRKATSTQEKPSEGAPANTQEPRACSRPDTHHRFADIQSILTVLGRRKTDAVICLSRTDLRRARLWKADLEHARLDGAQLEGACLSNADLTDAYLRDAYLEGADLEHADLRGADLRGAILGGATLRNADLRSAHLWGALGLTQEQLNSACVDDRTELPGSLKRPARRACCDEPGGCH
jgi:hypothetical protein